MHITHKIIIAILIYFYNSAYAAPGDVKPVTNIREAISAMEWDSNSHHVIVNVPLSGPGRSRQLANEEYAAERKKADEEERRMNENYLADIETKITAIAAGGHQGLTLKNKEGTRLSLVAEGSYYCGSLNGGTCDQYLVASNSPKKDAIWFYVIQVICLHNYLTSSKFILGTNSRKGMWLEEIKPLDLKITAKSSLFMKTLYEMSCIDTQ